MSLPTTSKFPIFARPADKDITVWAPIDTAFENLISENLIIGSVELPLAFPEVETRGDVKFA